MDTIRTIVVDDEEIGREGLNTLLAKDPEIDVVALCKDGKEALAKISELKPDLMLLDIQMPKMNGFEVLEAIPRALIPVIIFITAFDEYALRAFEVHALDYILKPFSIERLESSLERAKVVIRKRSVNDHIESLRTLIEDLHKNGDIEKRNDMTHRFLERIMVRVNDRIVFIEAGDIYWIEGADYYVYLHSTEGTFLYRESLKSLEEKLSPSSFFRIHKSAIVNLKRIKEITEISAGGCKVILEHGEKLSVSRRRKKALMDLGMDYFGYRH